MCEKIVTLDYDEALRYFDVDAETLEYLEKLSEEEKEGFVLEVTLNHARKSATWSMGNVWKETEHLARKGTGIDNTTEEEDDYVGACEKLHEMGESLGLELYTCEHCDETFEYNLPWQETCEVCGKSICDDHIVHVKPEEGS